MNIFTLVREQFKKIQPDKKVNMKRTVRRENIIRLSSNENQLGISPLVEKAILKEIKNQNYYPDSRSKLLREKLGKILDVSSDRIVVGNGSDELISIIASIFIEKEKNAICYEKTFPRYYHAIKINGGICYEIELNNFRYNLEAILDRIDDNSRIVFLSNPNNPTGTIFTHEETENYLKNIPETVVTIFDEAYFDFVNDEKFPKIFQLMDKYPNKPMVVLRTFSKVYGMAGLRVGYAVSNNVDLINIINWSKNTFNVNGLAQAGALAALDDDKFLKDVFTHCLKEKEKFYNFFDRENIEYVKSETNFILIKTNISGKKMADMLKKRGIMIRCMEDWKFPPGFVRITIGKEEENRLLRENLLDIIENKKIINGGK